MVKSLHSISFMQSSPELLAGSCLCGAVSYQAWAPFLRFAYCHCNRCRKATGTGSASNLYCSPTRSRWTAGENLISRYDLPTAKSFAVVCCKGCGSPLPRLTRSGREIVVPAGSLDTEPSMKPEANIFWQSRANWSCDPSALPTYPELPEWWLQRRDPQE
jgi:hypothetical protein